MIPPLDVAVERLTPRFAGRLGGRHAPEQVTERPRSTIPILATQPSFAPQTKHRPTRCLPNIAPLGWERIGFNGDYVWPSEPLKQKVSALRNLRSAFLDAANVRFGTDSLMTP